MRRIKIYGGVIVMKHSSVAFNARNEVGISKHIPITHLNSASIFEASNGMLGMVIKLDGVSFETKTNAELNKVKKFWQQSLNVLDEQFCLYVTMHRHKESMHLDGQFDNAFAKYLNDAYQRQFQQDALYVNDLYLTVVYKGIDTGKVGRGLNFFNRLADKAIKHARDEAREKQIKALQYAVKQMMVSLSVFKPRLLGEQDQHLGYSELLSFFSVLVNGGQQAPLVFPRYAAPITKYLKDALKTEQLYPFGNIAQYLPRKRLFFGENIQFQGVSQEDTHFAAIVTIKRYGTESSSTMLDPLLQLPGEFISTNSFAIESKEVALERIKRHVIKMANVNDPAASQIEALQTAKDMLASDQVLMGYHHNTLLLLSKTQKDLEDLVAKTISCYAQVGMIAIRETLGQEIAFWAQIPTNLKYIARASLITSENFIDFCPLHNYYHGYRDANHLGEAVSLLETPSKTPCFFNYHVKGESGNPSKGHCLIIGGNNSGKTVFMSFMDAQMTRYGGRTFYFDRDRGAEIYIRASGGYYAILSPDFPENSCFNPLKLADSAGNRQFNRDLLIQLCKNHSRDILSADVIEQLKQCVDYAYDKLINTHRTLSNATKILPMNFPHWTHLRRWLRTDGHYPDGDYAYIFDNVEDKLSFHHKMGFDMTHFLDREPSHVQTALLMYFFQRIEQALDGQRVSLLLDEGWQYFGDPYWQEKLARWLPTLRKKNAHIVIATQSPSSVIQSPLRSIMLDNVATQIYFANPQANTEDYIEGFKLTTAEFASITKNSPASRLFLVKQEHDTSLCRLNLSALPKILAVLSANTKTVNLLDSIRQEVGDEPEKWLPIFYKRCGVL